MVCSSQYSTPRDFAVRIAMTAWLHKHRSKTEARLGVRGIRMWVLGGEGEKMEWESKLACMVDIACQTKKPLHVDLLYFCPCYLL